MKTQSSSPSEQASSEAAPAVLVSACLLGVRCRYDGTTNPADNLTELTRGKQIIPICPEQLGGLSTPRPAAQSSGGTAEDVLDGKARVLTHSGADVTDNFLRGAHEAARLADQFGAREAILKDKSPSCGVCRVYRDGQLVEGQGVTAALLASKGLRLIPLSPPSQP